jgi:hypothetical protein
MNVLRSRITGNIFFIKGIIAKIVMGWKYFVIINA